jgi:hypothetical protein
MKILIEQNTNTKDTEMADIEERYKTYKSYPKSHKKKTVTLTAHQRTVNEFKKNVSKKSRKEWGERMNHLRSIV